MGTDIQAKDLKDLLNKSVDIIGDNSALTAGRGTYETESMQEMIGIMDLGAKQSIVNVIEEKGFKTLLLNPEITADQILSMNLRGLVISMVQETLGHYREL